ncbi:MAG TPA: MBL fold metallo-hydrolase [Actinomycetota bacterium]|nr:MBL fold metallo-hydrolase [Actinomycetota bacterium]
MSLEIFFHSEVGPLACNCYVVGDPATKEAIVIDPGGDIQIIVDALTEQQLRVTAIVATHAHFDHLVAARELRDVTGAPFHLHEDDRPLLDWYQESGRMFLGIDLPPPPEVDTNADEGDKLIAGSAELEIIHTPGHSPGSISLVSPGVVFSGDTLFALGVGRTDLPGGDERALVTAITTKIFSFADDTPVYPGHGPSTTVGREKQFNPFVGADGGLWTP